MNRMITLALLLAAGSLVAAESYAELDLNRIAEIEAMLPEKPAGYGSPYQDRSFWESPQTLKATQNVISAAEVLLKKDFPAWSDERYLEYSKSGRRPPGEAMQNSRSDWLTRLVLAECLENKGSFLPAILKILAEYVKEPTWVMPAHDRDLNNFHGVSCSVDLRSSVFSADLAQALYFLDDKIDPSLRLSIQEALEQRIFGPIQKTLETGKNHGWMGSQSSPIQNNWNAVCLGGVIGAARTILPGRHRRALFIAAGEHYSNYYINSFGDDGYCDEGPGYWNYGFGSYIELREVLAHATGGKVDLFKNPKIARCALYGPRIQLVEETAPPFSDCRFGTRINSHLVAYCDQVLHLGLGRDPKAASLAGKRLATQFMSITPLAQPIPVANPDQNPIRNYSYFDQAGVLVCRPDPGTPCRLAIAIKARGNGSHSHNDVGSFIISLGKEQPVGDPGGPFVYDNNTFSARRYQQKILNSFGHPVPVVGSTLQIEATRAKPVIQKTRFTPDEAEILIDMKPAYHVPELIRLERTMRYSRTGTGRVVITDLAEFSRPMDFEIALPTHGEWKAITPASMEFTSGAEKLTARIECPDELEFTAETIDELANPAFSRIGVKLKNPALKTSIAVIFTPGESAGSTTIMGVGAGDAKSTPAETTPAETTTEEATPEIPEAPEQTKLREQRMKWFREARFGLFIHWGVYAVPAGEWKGKGVVSAGEWIMYTGKIPAAEYRECGKGFTAANYDPKAWARLARAAGMKYVVITSKHHDGFALFDSAASDWNAVKSSAAGRDLIAPLAAAVRAEGLKFGCYYSQVQDWVNPGGAFFAGGKKYPPAQPGEFDEYLKKTALPQVKEVLDRYQPDIFWWDTPGSIGKERAKPFADLLAQHPSIISNDRLGGGFKGDTLTPEQHIPPRGYPGKMFEVCMTMNNTWGFKTSDTHWKSVRDLLRNLSDISSKGGNFLLNVGPTADGRIPEASVERLEAVGRWMQANSEAIYATEATPFLRRMTWGRVTQKVADTGATTLYLHVWDWPKDGRLVLPGLNQAPSAATLLANGVPLTAQTTAEGLVVKLPEKAPDSEISVVRLQFPGALTLNEYPLDAEGRIALTALDGDGTGGRNGNFKVRGIGADSYQAGWKDAQWTLDYRVLVPTAGSWQVSAEFASAEPANLILSSGKLSAKATVPAGADAKAWHTEVLGTLNLPAGEQTIQLKGEKDGWNAGPDVRRIWLKPVPAIGAKAAKS